MAVFPLSITPNIELRRGEEVSLIKLGDTAVSTNGQPTVCCQGSMSVPLVTCTLWQRRGVLPTGFTPLT